MPRQLNRAESNASQAAYTIHETRHFMPASARRTRAVAKRQARRADRRASKAALAEACYHH